MRNIKIHAIKGTKFHVYYGGAGIDGTNKWVISTAPQDYDLLDKFLEEEDQLWHTKKEAVEVVQSYLASK